jgi:hypothetical protein
MSPPQEATAGPNGGIRREQRNMVNEKVELANLGQSRSVETTTTQNTSPNGARVTTHRLWEPGSFLLLKSLRGDFWARARVIYWRSYSSSSNRASIGLEFIVRGGDWPAEN